MSDWETYGGGHQKVYGENAGTTTVLNINSDGALESAPVAQATAEGYSHEPAANTAAEVTLAAPGEGVCNVIANVIWSYDGDPTGGKLTIEDGAGQNRTRVDITKGGPGQLSWNPPLKFTANTATIITLAAGGAGVSGIVNIHTWTEPA